MGIIKELILMSTIGLIMCISLSLLRLNTEYQPSTGIILATTRKESTPYKKGMKMWWHNGKLKIKFR